MDCFGKIIFKIIFSDKVLKKQIVENRIKRNPANGRAIAVDMDMGIDSTSNKIRRLTLILKRND